MAYAYDPDPDPDHAQHTHSRRLGARPWYELELELAEDLSHDELEAMRARSRPSNDD